MRNKLFTSTIDKQLFNQYKFGSDLSKQKVVTKIFNPYGEGRWYLLNSDPNDPDYIWAIVSMHGNVEIGSVSRQELFNLRLTKYRFPLERDLYFTPKNAKEVYDGLMEGRFYAKGGLIKLGDNVHIPAENKTGYVTNVVANGEHYSVKFVDGTKKVYDKDEIEKIKEFAEGGGIGFVPIDVEEKLVLLSKWGGIDVKGVISLLNAMIDTQLTDNDLVINPPKNTRFQREKAIENKVQQIWKEIEPNYNGNLKGNQYYSTIKELVARNFIYKNLLQRFKPFRKYQTDKFAYGGVGDNKLKRLKSFLDKFPDDAKTWNLATDELRDLSRSIRMFYNEVDLDVVEQDPKALKSMDFRSFKTPSEWNTKSKDFILSTYNKMSDKAKNYFFEKHNDLFKNESDFAKGGELDMNNYNGAGMFADGGQIINYDVILTENRHDGNKWRGVVPKHILDDLEEMQYQGGHKRFSLDIYDEVNEKPKREHIGKLNGFLNSVGIRFGTIFAYAEEYAKGGGVAVTNKFTGGGQIEYNEYGVPKGYLYLSEFANFDRKASGELTNVTETILEDAFLEDQSEKGQQIHAYLHNLSNFIEYDNRIPRKNPESLENDEPITDNYLLFLPIKDEDEADENSGVPFHTFFIDTQGYDYPRYITRLVNYYPSDYQLEDLGYMARGGGVGKKSKGDIGKSGTQYGYTLKEWEQMAKKRGLLVSPSQWWKSQEGTTYTDFLGRKKKIGQHSQDERQSMDMYGYLIANGLDLGSEIIPTSAKKYVEENNYSKYAKGGMTSGSDNMYVSQLSSMSGTRGIAVKQWISSNHLSNDDVLNIIQGLGRKQISTRDFINAVLGDKKATMMVINYAKSGKGFMAKGGSLKDRSERDSIRLSKEYQKVLDSNFNDTIYEKYQKLVKESQIPKKELEKIENYIMTTPKGQRRYIDIYQYWGIKKMASGGRVDSLKSKVKDYSRYAKGGGVDKRVILSFSFNSDNISLDDVTEIVENYTKDWRTGGDIFEPNFYVNLRESEANDLKDELESYGYFYDIEIEDSRYQYADGGEMDSKKKVRFDEGGETSGQHYEPTYLMTLDEYINLGIPTTIKNYEKFIKKNGKYLARAGYSGLDYWTLEDALESSENPFEKYSDYDWISNIEELGGTTRIDYARAKDFDNWSDEKYTQDPTPIDIRVENQVFREKLSKYFPHRTHKYKEKTWTTSGMQRIENEFKKTNKVAIRDAMQDGVYKELLNTGKISIDRLKEITDSVGVRITKDTLSGDKKVEFMEGLKKTLSGMPQKSFDKVKEFAEDFHKELKELSDIVYEKEYKRLSDVILSFIGKRVEMSRVSMAIPISLFSIYDYTSEQVEGKTKYSYDRITMVDIKALQPNWEKYLKDYVKFYVESLKWNIVRVMADVFRRVTIPIKTYEKISLDLGKNGFEGRYKFNFEDGSSFVVNTQGIGAGGYNIQVFHYRYLTNITNATLPSGEVTKDLSHWEKRYAMGGEIKKHYRHKHIPTMTLEVLDYTYSGVKGLQKDTKSLSPKERKEGKMVFYSKADLNDLFEELYEEGGDVDFMAGGGAIKQNEGKLFNEKGEMLVYKKQSKTSSIYDVDVYEPRKTDVGEYSKFKYCKREKNGRECVYRLDKNALLEMIKKEKFIYAQGGLMGYERLVKKVAKNYEGKSVPKKYQSEYGKTYDKGEAKEVGYKVATKVYGIPLAKMKK